MSENFPKLPCKISSTIVSFCKHIWNEHKTLVIATVAVISAVKIHHVIKKRQLRQEWDSAGQDVVVLHGFLRSKVCPSLSPYVLKLETYLRMAGIEYKYEEDNPLGPQSKCPWITFNGKDYADSQLIMEFLGKKFDKDFSSHLSDEEKAIATSMRITTDEHMFWGLPWWRLVNDPDQRVYELTNLPCKMRLAVKYMSCKYARMLWAQGLGRHSDADVKEIIRKDIEALSIYLGKKPFLMGDEPCEVDCSVFGMIVQFVWGTPGSPYEAIVKKDFRNLEDYCVRMKEKYWPDWEQVLIK